MQKIKILLQAEFGTLDNLAKQLNIRSSAVYNWFNRKAIPIKHLKKIDELTNGRITKSMLRPDLFD